MDVDNERHRFLLHYIFRPRIIHTINSFVPGWNKHPLRTEKNWTPEKIWANGMLDLHNRGLCQVTEFQQALPTAYDLQWYGYDPETPYPSNIETNVVDVEDVLCPLSHDEMEVLSCINPLRHSVSFGIDIFMETLEMLNV